VCQCAIIFFKILPNIEQANYYCLLQTTPPAADGRL
jgi:hypothetical protein